MSLLSLTYLAFSFYKCQIFDTSDLILINSEISNQPLPAEEGDHNQATPLVHDSCRLLIFRHQTNIELVEGVRIAFECLEKRVVHCHFIRKLALVFKYILLQSYCTSSHLQSTPNKINFSSVGR